MDDFKTPLIADDGSEYGSDDEEQLLNSTCAEQTASEIWDKCLNSTQCSKRWISLLEGNDPRILIILTGWSFILLCACCLALATRADSRILVFILIWGMVIEYAMCFYYVKIIDQRNIYCSHFVVAYLVNVVVFSASVVSTCMTGTGISYSESRGFSIVCAVAEGILLVLLIGIWWKWWRMQLKKVCTC